VRIAALYDIHGNLPALEAVLVELERCEPDLVVVGGDVASGPMPAQTSAGGPARSREATRACPRSSPRRCGRPRT